MKSTIFAAVLFAALPVISAPTSYDVDWTKIDYPDGTGANLPYYPPPPGGWESVKYPTNTGSNGGSSCSYKSPFHFTSEYYVVATGAEVVNGTAPNTKSTPGPANAVGFFNYGINSKEETICWNITLINVPGTYQSLALTATHIHQAVKGATGPPRIAFPNPVSIGGNDNLRRSIGCMMGPFKTGIMAMGVDTGTGFKLSQIEANPAGFFTDVHTNLFVPGVVRGQLG